jgi:uncharacterized membrane protein YhaH (DUF805 family)
MQSLDPIVFLAVFQEMMGSLLWVLLAVIIIGTVAFVALLLKERTIMARRLSISQLIGLFGGVAALVLMVAVSSSGWTDAGGPVDWLLIGVIYGLGFAGTTIISYTIGGFFCKGKGKNS